MHYTGPRKYDRPPESPVASRSLAPETVKLPDTPIVRWWFEPGRTKIAITWFILAVTTLALFFFSKPPSVSPLIVSYLDILDPHSAWARQRIADEEGLSFYLSLLFIVSFCLFLLLTYVVALGSGPGPAPEEDGKRTRYFGFGHLTRDSRWLKFGGIVLIVMLVSNVALFPFYAKQLAQPDAELNGRLFRFVYFVAILSRLGGLFLAGGVILQLFLEDFGRPIRSFYSAYRSYFYPPLLAIAIVAFVFTQMDQFDGLFIELVSSWGNFVLFSLFLFPASIVIIWFTPSYLAFTDRQFANRRDSWDIVSRLSDPDPKYKRSPGLYAWTVLHKRLFPQLDVLPTEPVPDTYLNNRRERIEYPTAAFHRFRTFLALIY
ncbi:MAG: hypothetical protein AAFN92_16720, partial [Bacteroidota bacterium]